MTRTLALTFSGGVLAVYVALLVDASVAAWRYRRRVAELRWLDDLYAAPARVPWHEIEEAL